MKMSIALIVLLLLPFNSISSFLDEPLWTKATSVSKPGLELPDSEVYYIDLHSMKKKKDDYVYYSVLVDLSKPDKSGHKGWKLSVQGDCNSMRARTLTETHYTIPTKLVKLPSPSSGFIETDETYMGPSVEIAATNEWVNLNKDSAFGYLLNWVCMMKDVI